MSHFFIRDGYGLYIFSAFGIVWAVLLILAFYYHYQHRQFIRGIHVD